ncbi:MAG TPA: hypothetical protein VK722_21830 [Candidatus Aquilonibacter sp.]|nr:hypothetical protein [Candidatus Aquilonibacter sp.]
MTSSGSRHFLSVRRFSFYLLVFFVCSISGPRVLPAHASSGPKKLKPSDPYALIFGTVWGPDQHPAYGVKVKIRLASEKKPRWELYSDHQGEFALRVVAAKNDYIVGADLKGIKAQDGQPLHLVEEVPVHVEYDERVDIGLHLAR